MDGSGAQSDVIYSLTLDGRGMTPPAEGERDPRCPARLLHLTTAIPESACWLP